ncbi:MAG: recombinase RecT [Methylophaga sp.]|nr:recombinase RecT [Methylophaga sp.]
MSIDIVSIIKEAKPAFDNILAIAKENNEVPPVNFAREAGFALQLLESNSYLAKMSKQSIINAVKNVALCGITLNPSMKLAYLVPREGRACLDISYMGLIKIATDSGSVTKVNCQLVYENDEFLLNQGSNQSLIHRPNPFKDRGKLIGVYTVATLHNGEIMIETMDMKDIESIKKRSKSFTSGNVSPWKTDEGEMIRKTCIKRASKYWTKTERLQTAIQAVNEHEGIDFNEQPKKPEFYSDSDFKKNFPKWQQAIELGKKSADEIIIMVNTKAQLTDEQQNMIRAVAAPIECEVVA